MLRFHLEHRARYILPLKLLWKTTKCAAHRKLVKNLTICSSNMQYEKLNPNYWFSSYISISHLRADSQLLKTYHDWVQISAIQIHPLDFLQESHFSSSGNLASMNLFKKCNFLVECSTKIENKYEKMFEQRFKSKMKHDLRT